jgi:ABC-type antimicrobial peptide transport system permease subunit
MRVRRQLAQAARSTSRYRARAALMMLGIVVGIASLAALSAVGEATKRETMARFKNMLGTFDTIMVRPGGGRTRGMPTVVNVPPTLRFDDAAAIARLPNVRAVAEMQSAFDIDITYRDKAASPGVFGVSPNWLALRADNVADGAFFTAEQNASLARVAVLGTDVRALLFAGENPVGQTIRIAGIPFEVIGTLASRGAGPAGGSLDNVVLVPVSTASRRLFNRDYLTMAIAELRDPLRSDETAARVTQLLRDRHRIAPPALDDFTITNPAATMARVTEAGRTFTTLLTGVAVLALAIGGIVILSLMSIAVTERRTEIGVRRSVGASRAEILVQFGSEALIVAASGGAIGAAIAVGVVRVATTIERLPAVFVWQPFAAAVALSIVIGVVCGAYPAWKASQVDPIQALRP